MADMPPDAWAIVKRMFNEKRMEFPATEDGARAWTRATCEQLLFAEPTGGWCAKSASRDRPQSKDVIARQLGGRFEGWGVLTAAGAQGPRQLTDPPEYFDLAGQNPIPVSPVDHLAAAPPDDAPGDGDTSDPDADHRELLAACDRIATGLFDVVSALTVLSVHLEELQRDGIRVRLN